ncbi:hypothetical protein [Mucilaginibacter sp. SG564]|uniref:hypothetical protein n=1 Tax=Mucilaginibacter sp. SG564 TaxID=2587022 RepID=UPI0015553B94|nr:hypothetical protein [Mucilaginibacter sp. SG564]NOW95853.1 hypothetical protein [Mucilaginibacter sp. SG564]
MRRHITRFTMLCGMSFLAACQGGTAEAQSFIDGMYLNHARGIYAIADDTLIFTHTLDKYYIITRHTGYQRIRDGKLLPKMHKLERVEGDFDRQSNLLRETTAGRVFRFDPDKGILILKQAVYRKLN